MSYSLSFTKSILVVIFISDKIRRNQFEFLSTADISKYLSIPKPTLVKILQNLNMANIIETKEGKQGVVIKAYEWTHKHVPNLMDCRPIYVRRAIEAAGFDVKETDIEHMWVPVEIVLAVKPSDADPPEGQSHDR